MEVKLKLTWFAPSGVRRPNTVQSMSGRRYRAGTHRMPDELRPLLPSTALVKDGDQWVLANPPKDGKPVAGVRMEAPDVVPDRPVPTPPADADPARAAAERNARLSLEADIRYAVGTLDPGKDEHWTKAGRPDCRVLSEILNQTVTREMLDAAVPDAQRPG